MNDSNPKISVIIPVYNPGKGILQCLKSLRYQTLKDIEMIFIDDCGEDGSVEYIRQEAAKDARIRILVNDVNSGAGFSRNRGIEDARGEYLSFVDPDDYVADNFLNLLYTKTFPNKPDIVKGERLLVDPSGKILIELGRRPLNGQIRSGLAKGRPIYNLFTYSHWTAIFRREYILKSGVRYGLTRNAQDSTFLLRAGYYAQSIALEDRAIYYYVAREQSRMNDCSALRLRQDLMAFHDQAQFILENNDDSNEQKKYLCQRILYLLRIHAWASKTPKMAESTNDFLHSLKDMICSLPFADDLKRMNVIIEALLQYDANLSILPYRVQEQDPPIESRVEVIHRWAEFMKNHPDCALKSRYGYQWRNAYVMALSDSRLSPRNTSSKKKNAYYRAIRRETDGLQDTRMLFKSRALLLFLRTGVNSYQMKRVLKALYLHMAYPKLR